MPTKICYIAGREATYSRSRNIITALQRGGFEVVTCLPPKKGVQHYPKLLWQFMAIKSAATVVRSRAGRRKRNGVTEQRLIVVQLKDRPSFASCRA